MLISYNNKVAITFDQFIMINIDFSNLKMIKINLDHSIGDQNQEWYLSQSIFVKERFKFMLLAIWWARLIWSSLHARHSIWLFNGFFCMIQSKNQMATKEGWWPNSKRSSFVSHHLVFALGGGEGGAGSKVLKT